MWIACLTLCNILICHHKISCLGEKDVESTSESRPLFRFEWVLNFSINIIIINIISIFIQENAIYVEKNILDNFSFNFKLATMYHFTSSYHYFSCPGCISIRPRNCSYGQSRVWMMENLFQAERSFLKPALFCRSMDIPRLNELLKPTN